MCTLCGTQEAGSPADSRLEESSTGAKSNSSHTHVAAVKFCHAM